MAVLKCKICGGTLDIKEGESVAVCEYCGTRQTIPRLDDERKANMYDRASHFRRLNEYDKAMDIYEQILSEDNTDAESYWSLVLCRYGIEYVEDPATRRYIPTVNRMQYTSVLADEDYKSALHYADGYQREIYEAEARAIDQIQKGIMAISQKEEPFDIFICYKETDNSGRRTPDSVLAFDMYDQLTKEGFRVFFSRVTLEDKLGQEYEPYIFAALNSARVMIAVGTRPEYFNAPWVKNEWGRYLALIKDGARKTLIPAYRDMDPYDLPDEFSHLQAQDMSRLGFMQDLIHGVHKIIDADKPREQAYAHAVHETAPSGSVDVLLKRGGMELEDGEWEKADEFYESALNQDAECGAAYLGKLLVREKCTSIDSFIRKLSERFQAVEKEVLIACEEDAEKVSRIKERLQGKAKGSFINRLTDLDLTFQSEQNSLRRQKEAYQDYLDKDRLLQRARQYLKGAGKERLEEGLAGIGAELDRRIAEAKADDEQAAARIKAQYGPHLNEAEEKTAEIERQALKKKEKRERRMQKGKAAIARVGMLIWKVLSILIIFCAVYDITVGADKRFGILLLIPYACLLYRIHKKKGSTAGLAEYLAMVLAAFSFKAASNGESLMYFWGIAFLFIGLLAGISSGKKRGKTAVVAGPDTEIQRIAKVGILFVTACIMMSNLRGVIYDAEREYQDAKEQKDNYWHWDEALASFKKLGMYRDSAVQVQLVKWDIRQDTKQQYDEAADCIEDGRAVGSQWETVYDKFGFASWHGDESEYEYVYKDADEKAKEVAYYLAEYYLAEGRFDDAKYYFSITGDNTDAQERLKEMEEDLDLSWKKAAYNVAADYGELIESYEDDVYYEYMAGYFKRAGDYEDAQERLSQSLEQWYQYAKGLLESQYEFKLVDARSSFSSLAEDYNYKDSAELEQEADRRLDELGYREEPKGSKSGN